jgi:hypothetical protein
MKQTLLIGLLSTAALLALSTTAFAETPAEKGLRIAKAADASDVGYGDFSSDMKMILTNRAGGSSTRVMRSKTLEGANGKGDKSLSLFDLPADVKGTKMLTFSHGLKPDDQWLYLPALKRVKRINSRNKSGPFMGSEFAFEDLGSQEVEKYTYNYLREEACGQWKCHVMERIPAYKYSGYTKQVAWIDTVGYRVTKVMYYDRKNALLKTLTATGYKQYLGKFWRPAKMAMINHQSGKGTTLEWTNYAFKKGLKSRDFNSKSLKR